MSNSLQPHGLQPTKVLSMGFPRQEYLSGLPFSSPEGLPNPEIEPESLTLAGRFFTAKPPAKPYSLLPYRVLTSFVSISKFILAFLIDCKYVCSSDLPLNHINHLMDFCFNKVDKIFDTFILYDFIFFENYPLMNENKCVL